MFDYMRVPFLMGDDRGSMGGGGGRAGGVGKPGVGGGFDGNKKDKDQKGGGGKAKVDIERRSSNIHVSPGDEKGGQSQRDGNNKVKPKQNGQAAPKDDNRSGGADVVEEKKRRAGPRVVGVPGQIGVPLNSLFGNRPLF